MAVYLSKQDYASLLSAIASKLQIPISTIGPIYHYDQNMTPVVVNETSITLMPHEQDFIVRLGWNAAQPPVSPFEAQQQLLCAPDVFNHHANGFDQYLTVPLGDSYTPSAESWSDFTDDASMSVGHMVAHSVAISPDGGLPYEKPQFLHQNGVGEQWIDYASYTVDAILPMMSLSSTPIDSTLHLGTLPPQAEILQMTDFENRLDQVTAPPLKAVSTNEETRLHNGRRPASSQHYRHPPSAERTDIEARSEKIDQDTAYALERNRLAAVKCRLTRKQKETRLQDLSKEKLEMNTELKREVMRLEAEITEAKMLLKMHNTCV